MKVSKFHKEFMRCVNDRQPPQQVYVRHMDLLGHLDVDNICAAGGVDERVDEPFNEIMINVKIPEELIKIAEGKMRVIDHAIETIKLSENAFSHDRCEKTIAQLNELSEWIGELTILTAINEMDKEE